MSTIHSYQTLATMAAVVGMTYPVTRPAMKHREGPQRECRECRGMFHAKQDGVKRHGVWRCHRCDQKARSK